MSRISRNLKNIFIVRTSWLILVAIVNRFLNINEDFSYVILSFYAMFGHIYAIQALIFCFLFRHLNDSFNINTTFEMSYLVIISSIISIFVNSKLHIIKKKSFFVSSFFLFTIFFGFFLIIHGFFFSQFMIISFLKSFIWLLLSISLFIAFSSLSTKETLKLQKNFFWSFFIIILISIPLYFVPVIGYEHDGRGFQGIFNHPQIFGIILSLFSSIVLIILLDQKNFSLKTIFFLSVLIFCLILIFMTAARTALFSFLFSLLIFIFFSIFFRKKSFFKVYNIFFNKNFNILIIIFLFFLIFYYDYFYKTFLNFIEKDQNIQNIVDSYISSRMIVIGPMIENIKTKWLTGIGFGMPSLQPDISLNRITFDALSFFTYEKGNVFLSIQEELGLLGFLIFTFWLFLLIQRLILSGDNIALIVVINILLTNLGEAVLFSTGGLGLFLLILLFWAATRPNSLSKNSYEKF